MELKNVYVNDVLDNINIYGRGYYDAKERVLFFNWTNSSIEFTFTGKRILGDFMADCGIEIDGLPYDDEAPRRKNWPYFGVIIDDAEEFAKTFTININDGIQKVPLFESDSVETHKIRIIKLSENYKTYGGLVGFDMDGNIVYTDRPDKKRIEFVGDSITCGFGNGTLDPNGLFHSTDENGYMSHGAIAARLLNMEASIVSVSGICSTYIDGVPNEYAMDEIYQYLDRPNEDRLYKKDKQILNKFGELDWSRKDAPLKDEDAYTKWDFAKNHNDIVVINLGTNDRMGIMLSEDQPAAWKSFLKGYRRFIKQVRKLNGPDTYIICALGSMDYFLYAEIKDMVEEYIANTDDINISTFRYMPICPFDGYGTGLHPAMVTHKKMAEEIATEIRGLGLVD